jgi:hypothetical protein
MVQESSNTENEKVKDYTTKFFPVAYGLFVLLGIYNFIKGEYITAASNLGIALIFDPFNPKVIWQNRPMYQKAVLLVQVTIVLGLLVYGFFIK